MTAPRPFIKSWPCEGCEEPLEAKCWCERYCDVERICTLAYAVAEAANLHIRHFEQVPTKSVYEWAQYQADSFDNLLLDIGGRLDVESFFLACGLTPPELMPAVVTP